MSDRAQVAILIGAKGRGSNMQALIRACLNGEVPANPKVVIAPQLDSPGAQNAQQLGVAVAVVPPGDEYGSRLLEALEGVDWICLAGFTRLLPVEIVQKFDHRILNIHPALLPKYGGRGMYGRHVHQAVLDAEETESGCSVHWVTEHYDEGGVILQMQCPVLSHDTPETLSQRVLALEHKAYPAALAEVIRRGS